MDYEEIHSAALEYVQNKLLSIADDVYFELSENLGDDADNVVEEVDDILHMLRSML